MSAKKISTTKNYRLFQRHSSENRPLDIKRHKRLVESMKQYGFLACFPIVVIRDSNGNLIVKDGQHRLSIAETLGLPVHYVEDDQGFDVAVVNSTAKVWVLGDYARKFAANGSADYQEAIEFSETHTLPIGTAVSLLSGTTSFSNIQNEFIEGTWSVKDRDWAEAVAGIYVPMVRMSPVMRNARFIEACMSVCRVSDFKANRLLQNAERCREKLVAFSTRDAYLDMLESVYNFGRRDLLGLKAAATMAMKRRSPTNRKRLASSVCAA